MLNANPMPIRHKGNDDLFLAVEMSLLSTLGGTPLHVHAEGLRGTGKTTVMQWAKRNRPDITRVKDCPYHCDPTEPHCPSHGGTEGFETERSPMPFVEIGHGAKLGTILGSIDLGRLTNENCPQAALLPGSIPQANRGVLFIDEINRLAETAPEITDVLLSVMGTKPGRVKIEEVGLKPCEIEICTSVWAASNPDEEPGPLDEIRKQLADRFDLVVAVQRPSETSVVESLLLAKTLSRKHEALPVQKPVERFAHNLYPKALNVKDTLVPPEILRYMAHLYVHRNVESLRAIESLELSSRLLAALRGKDSVSFDEILRVIPMVLRHRVDPLSLSEILKDLELRKAAGTQIKDRPRREDDSEPPASPHQEEKQSEAANNVKPTFSADKNPNSSPDPSLKQRTPPDGSTPGKESGGKDKQGLIRRVLSRCKDVLHGNRPVQTMPTPTRSLKPVSPPSEARPLRVLPADQFVSQPLPEARR